MVNFNPIAPRHRFGVALTNYIQEATENGHLLVDLLVSIVKNDLYMEVDGEQVRVPVKPSEQMTAADRLFERGFGKIAQTVEIEALPMSEMEAYLANMSAEDLEAEFKRLSGPVIETTGTIIEC